MFGLTLTPDQIAPLPVAIPMLVAAVLIAAEPLIHQKLAGAFALLAALTAVGACAGLLLASRNGLLTTWFGGWQPSPGVALGISFAIDPLGAGLALLTAILVTAVLIYAWQYFESIGTLFHTLLLVYLAAMCGFCLSGDLFNLFVWFELMGVAAYALTGYKVEEEGPIQGGLNFAIVNSLGAFLVLFGIGLLYGRTGQLNLAEVGRALNGGPADSLVVAAFTLITVGLLVKAAMVPLHFWLADAHAVAPTPVCVLLSGVMVELGLFGVLRVYWTVFAGVLSPDADGVRTLLLVVGALTAVVGAVMCYLQRHLKRLLAFSTISHAGTFLLGAALLSPGGLAGAAIDVLGHGLVKGALFMASGILLHRFGSVDEHDLRGLGRWTPVAGVVFGLGGLALAGLPPFTTAYGHSVIEQAATDAGVGAVTLVLAFSSVLTGGAVLRATGRVFLCLGRGGDISASAPSHGQELKESNDYASSRTPLSMLVPAVALLLAALVLGVVHGPLAQTTAAAARFQDQSGYVASVLDNQPMALHLEAEPAAFDVSGIAWGIASAVAAVGLAALSLSIRPHPRGAVRWLEAGVCAIAGPLRRVHTGHVGDYVLWLMAALIAFGTASALTLH